VGFDDFCSPLLRTVFVKKLDLEDIPENSLLFYYIATAVRSGVEDLCLTRRRRITSSISACRCKYKLNILNTQNHLITSTHVSSSSSAAGSQGHQVDLCLVPETVPPQQPLVLSFSVLEGQG